MKELSEAPKAWTFANGKSFGAERQRWNSAGEFQSRSFIHECRSVLRGRESNPLQELMGLPGKTLPNPPAIMVLCDSPDRARDKSQQVVRYNSYNE